MNYAQKAYVYTWISRLGTSSFTVEHAIRDEHNNWIARGKAILASFDFTERKAVPLTNKIKERLLEHHEGPIDVPALR
jgi:acyl-CoA thioester hydrolase